MSPRVSITFDDCSQSQITYGLLPMRALRFRGTLGVVTGRVGDRYHHTDAWQVDSLYWSQIAGLQHADGWEIASHSRMHRSINNPHLKGPYASLSDQELKEEICGSKIDLEARYFPSPVTFIRPGNQFQNPLAGRDLNLTRSCFPVVRLYEGNTPAKPSLNDFSPGSLQRLASTHLRSYPGLLADMEELLAGIKEGQWVVFAVHGIGFNLGGSTTITPSDFEGVLKLLKRAGACVLTLREGMETLRRQSSD